MPAPLVLTSSPLPGEGSGPRNDVREVAARLGADVLAPSEGRALPDLVRRRLRLDLPQALEARRSTAPAFLCLSERVGIPLRALRTGRPQATVVHSLTDPAKIRLARAAGLQRAPSRLGVFSREQVGVLRATLGAEATFVPYSVDEGFWHSRPDDDTGDDDRRDYVLTVGREQRDWATLTKAVTALGVRCVVVGGSPWSHRAGPAADGARLEQRSGLSNKELRALYAGARAVVVPLHGGLRYAAGLTTLCEAQATGRPVIVSDTPGLRGEVLDGRTGVLVPPADATALAADLRTAQRTVLRDDDRAGELGAAARQHAATTRSFAGYVEALCALVPTG